MQCHPVHTMSIHHDSAESLSGNHQLFMRYSSSIAPTLVHMVQKEGTTESLHAVRGLHHRGRCVGGCVLVPVVTISSTHLGPVMHARTHAHTHTQGAVLCSVTQHGTPCMVVLVFLSSGSPPHTDWPLPPHGMVTSYTVRMFTCSSAW